MLHPLISWKEVDKALSAADSCIAKHYDSFGSNPLREAAKEDFKAGRTQFYGVIGARGTLEGYVRIIPQGCEAYVDTIVPLSEENVLALKDWAMEQERFSSVYVNARLPTVHYTLPEEELSLIALHLERRPLKTDQVPSEGRAYAVFDLASTR